MLVLAASAAASKPGAHKEDTLDKCTPRSLGVTGRLVLAALPSIESSFARE